MSDWREKLRRVKLYLYAIFLTQKIKIENLYWKLRGNPYKDK